MRRIIALGFLEVLVGTACAPLDLRDGGNPPPDGATDSGAADGGVSGDGGSEMGLPLAGACAVLNHKRCAYLQGCGLIGTGGSALDDCAAYLAQTSCNPIGWPARVAAGTLGYDGVEAMACADAYAGRSCQDYLTQPAACADFLSPVVPLKGLCYGAPYAECLAGVCRGTTCQSFQCQPPGQAGDYGCATDTDCQTDAGLYCHFNGPNYVSQCELFSPKGGLCDAQTRCGQGLFCNGTTCQLLLSLNQPCAGDTCIPGAWCSTGVPDAGHCVARLDAGAGCTDTAQCAAGEICAPEVARCAPQGPLAGGARCYREQVCAAGLACVGTTPTAAGTCAAPLSAAATCGSSWDCELELTCVPADGGMICDLRRGDGSACGQDRDCQWGSSCVQQSCTRIPRPGEACPGGSCWYGACLPGDGGQVCSGPAAAGAVCDRDLDCASLQCVGACLPACGP